MKMIRFFVMGMLVGALIAGYVGWVRNNELTTQVSRLVLNNMTHEEENKNALKAEAHRNFVELQKYKSDIEEVHKLRVQVRQLQAAAAATEELRNENFKLRSLPAKSAATAPTAPTTPAANTDHFAKSDWTFAGYSTPEASLISAVWSMAKGDPQAYMAGLTPEEQARMTQQWQGKTAEEIAAKHLNDTASITGVRVLERQVIADDQVQVKVLTEGPDRVSTAILRRIDGQWKYDGMVRPPAK